MHLVFFPTKGDVVRRILMAAGAVLCAAAVGTSAHADTIFQLNTTSGQNKNNFVFVAGNGSGAGFNTVATNNTFDLQENGTDLGDVTLSFTGLTEVGSIPPIGAFAQGLSSGTFSIKEGSTTLLEGSITDAAIQGRIPSNQGQQDTDYLNGSVTLTGGTLLTSAFGHTNASENFQFSLGGAKFSASGGQLAGFSALGTGNITAAAPAPASQWGGLALLAMIGGVGLRCRYRPA